MNLTDRKNVLEDYVKHILLLATILSAGMATARAEGETPRVSGAGTRTPIQVAQGTTPTEAGSATTPSKETQAAYQQPSKVVFCTELLTTYRRVALGSPELKNSNNAVYNGLVGVSATVARHSTLERMITMAWSQQCDMYPFLKTESEVVRGTYLTPEAR